MERNTGDGKIHEKKGGVVRHLPFFIGLVYWIIFNPTIEAISVVMKKSLQNVAGS